MLPEEAAKLMREVVTFGVEAEVCLSSSEPGLSIVRRERYYFNPASRERKSATSEVDLRK